MYSKHMTLLAAAAVMVRVCGTVVHDVCTQEVEYHRSRELNAVCREHNKFVSVVSGFLSVSAFNFSELEEKYREAKSQVSLVTVD